jgi:hypothetical protein
VQLKVTNKCLQLQPERRRTCDGQCKLLCHFCKPGRGHWRNRFRPDRFPDSASAAQPGVVGTRFPVFRLSFHNRGPSDWIPYHQQWESCLKRHPLKGMHCCISHPCNHFPGPCVTKCVCRTWPEMPCPDCFHQGLAAGRFCKSGPTTTSSFGNRCRPMNDRKGVLQPHLARSVSVTRPLTTCACNPCSSTTQAHTKLQVTRNTCNLPTRVHMSINLPEHQTCKTFGPHPTPIHMLSTHAHPPQVVDPNLPDSTRR